MKIERFSPYELDELIKEKITKEKRIVQCIYQNDTAVVLGRVTPHTSDVNLERCLEDNIPVLRRRGGGGAVLLFPGVLVTSCTLKKDDKPVDLLKFLETSAMQVKEGIENYLEIPIDFRGSGDLCIGDKKILGSSIYSTKEYITYYATLILRGDTSLISRYLLHPSKEPEYRKGRPHEDFVTSIEEHKLIDNDKDLNQSILRSLKKINLNLVF